MISPSISPLEMKKRIDAGQVWVPIRKAEMIDPGVITGYEDVQKVSWYQGEEPSPFDLGLDVGVVKLVCTVRTTVEGEKTMTHFDPCTPISTFYGLITEDCERYVGTCESCESTASVTEEATTPCEEAAVEETEATEQVPASV